MRYAAPSPRNVSFPARMLCAAVIFVCAYMVTVSVRAEDTVVIGAGDAVQLRDDDTALITGTIVEAKDNVLVIDSNGRRMKIDLGGVKMKTGAEDVFQSGMSVTIEGEMKGDDFGVPLVKARTVTAGSSPMPVLQDANPGTVVVR